MLILTTVLMLPIFSINIYRYQYFYFDTPSPSNSEVGSRFPSPLTTSLPNEQEKVRRATQRLNLQFIGRQ